MNNMVLGIDIGGTKCTVCLGNRKGEVIKREEFPTDETRGPDPAVERFLCISERFIETSKCHLEAVGISCGSPLDPEKGIINAPPNLQSWVNVPIIRIFNEKFCVQAFLDNDANAGACAELLFGAGRGCKDMVYLTFGTGMGAGIIINGNIYRGANCYSGEVGHIRLEKNGPIGVHKSGSFEGFCSGSGIKQLAKREFAAWKTSTILGEDATAKEVGEAAKKGDALAIRILEISGRYLGLGLAYIIDILNPERIVIGSIFPRCEKFLRPAMEVALRLEALPQSLSACEIVGSELGERISDYASLSVALLALAK